MTIDTTNMCSHLQRKLFEEDGATLMVINIVPFLVYGIDIDYETVGANGSMLMVATSGTAVVI